MSLKVLIACEESQEVCRAFRELGHEAFSCDILPCSGGHPEWHIQQDLFGAILRKKWDFIGLHCPCTYTSLCGNRWYWNSPLREQGIQFTKKAYELACYVCPHVYLEQPKTIMQKYIGKKSQVIHPYQHGHKEYKETWLWLKGLPPLLDTSNVLKWMLADNRSRYEKVFRMPPSKDRAKLRSKTYPGIAQAMASQWSKYLEL